MPFLVGRLGLTLAPDGMRDSEGEQPHLERLDGPRSRHQEPMTDLRRVASRRIDRGVMQSIN